MAWERTGKASAGRRSPRPDGVADGAKGLGAAPDQLCLHGHHQPDHQQDLADPAVVADIGEVRDRAKDELARHQGQEQPYGERPR